MTEMVDLEISEEECTGCAACANICRKKAIHMEKKRDGFSYPVIDMEKCIGCNQCFQVCEARKTMVLDSPEVPVVYAMQSKMKDLRRHSTSGGIFSELAECILRRKGNVAGAVYRPDWSVEHRMIQDLEDLESVRRSKYQQSNINFIFREIKAALDGKKQILFCGTPCQVGGLKAFLGKEYEDLFTCDFICRGVSSPKIFAGYIEDLKNSYGSEVESVWMKNKCNGWHSLTTVIGFQNGEKYIRKGLEDSYVRLYLKYNAGVRSSCYECQFKGERSAADITLGDFWGLEGTGMDDNLGTSVVIGRTGKGRGLIEEIKERVRYEKKELEDVRRGNPCLYHSIEKKDINMERFYDILESEGYQEAVRQIAEDIV